MLNSIDFVNNGKLSPLLILFLTQKHIRLFYDLLCATTITGAFDKCLFSVHSPQLEKSVLQQSWHIDSPKRGFRSHDIYHYYPFSKQDPNGVVIGGETERFGVLTDDDMKKQGYKRKVKEKEG